MSNNCEHAERKREGYDTVLFWQRPSRKDGILYCEIERERKESKNHFALDCFMIESRVNKSSSSSSFFFPSFFIFPKGKGDEKGGGKNSAFFQAFNPIFFIDLKPFLS